MDSSNKEQISINDFTKLNIVLGTILDASKNTKAIKPAYILKIDFGKVIGTKQTSAQITNYTLEELVNRQVVAVCNLPSKKLLVLIPKFLYLVQFLEMTCIYYVLMSNLKTVH